MQGNLLPALCAGTLAFLYFLRFKARENKHVVDYLKLAGIFMLVPATYIAVAIPFICTFLAFIFLLDRLIIRNTMNKTTQIIVFSLMALFCLSFLVYAFIKADEAKEADKARVEADEQRLEAEKLKDEAEKLQEMALSEAANAQKQARLAEQALADCQSK